MSARESIASKISAFTKISEFTIKTQSDNQHWKIKYNQRGNYDINDDDIKAQVFADIKYIMAKYPGSVQQSVIQDDRYSVTGKDGLHYILQKKRKRNQNSITTYIPITVLGPNMKFN